MSNEFFEQYKNIKNGWWDRLNIDLKDEAQKDRWHLKIFEFELECMDFANDEERSCTKWKCTTRTPDKDGQIDLQVFDINNNNFDPSAYTFDAVVVDGSNRVRYILEFDGSDHFYPRRNTDIDITNKIVSDQIKNNFARSFEIPIKRIPYFAKKKSGNFEQEFQKHIIDMLSEHYVEGYTKPTENINPAVRQVPAYKIRKMIK